MREYIRGAGVRERTQTGLFVICYAWTRPFYFP
jgi:hypothetical protein